MSSTAAVRRAAWALIAGAAITAIGGVAGQVVRASTDVSDDLFRYPWTSEAFVATSILWAISQALLTGGLIGLRRSGVAGPTRAARSGLAVAIAGMAVFVVAELASIPVRDQQSDETAAGLVGALFGLATLLTAIGLTAAGAATARARLWEGWRRFAPLACGIWTFALLGLVLTSVMQASIAVFGLLLLAIGVALLTRPAPRADAAPAPTASTSPIALG